MRTTACIEYKCSCGWSESAPLHRLYFCPYCFELRCMYCLQDEINFYYCPNCLFEVPSALVKSGKNRCNRNCYKCSVCTSTMVLVNRTEEETNISQQLNVENDGSIYGLLCPNCGWLPKLTFDKPSTISTHYQKKEQDSAIFREFEHLYEHYKKITKSKNIQNPYQSQEISWYNRPQFDGKSIKK